MPIDNALSALDCLRLPLIAAPMFTISGPELVIAATKGGIVGAFPALNADSSTELDTWLTRIKGALEKQHDAAPFAVNLITHPTNPRLDADLEVVLAHEVPIVITSVGAPDRIVERIHEYGGLVFSDVASVKHAQKAAAIGVDGMVLLCAGAGGQTGTLNPLAFVSAVREFFDKILIIAGSITNGRQVAAIQLMGADLAYAGSAFIMAEESKANEAYRKVLADGIADDIVADDSLTGIPVNLVQKSIKRKTGSADSTTADPMQYDVANISWRDGLYTAGHGISALKKSRPCAEIVGSFAEEYSFAVQDFCRASAAKGSA